MGVERRAGAYDRWMSQHLISATERRGPALTPVSQTRLQTADMCCHAAEMHLGSTGMETASAVGFTLQEGAWGCMSGCSEVNSCIWLIAAVQIISNRMRFQAQMCHPELVSFKCQGLLCMHGYICNSKAAQPLHWEHCTQNI